MSDIFLSYNEKDREIVRRLADTFKSVGWSVWWDRRIPAGGTWRTLLEAELQSMRCMVVVWSANSIKSDWVHEEATEGRTAGRLVPVSIEAVRPPPGFREIQSADLVGWDGTTTWPNMRTLIEDIESLIGRPAAAAPGLPDPAPISIAAKLPEPREAPPSQFGIASIRPAAVAPEKHDESTRWTGARMAFVAAVVVTIVGSAIYFRFHDTDVERAARADDGTTRPLQDGKPTVDITANAGNDVTPKGPDGSATSSPTGGPAKSGRCSNLIQRFGIGDTLSPADLAYMKKAC